MCGVPEAQLALAVVSTVAGFQNEKRVAQRNEAANEVTMGNINEAYMNDLSKIDVKTSKSKPFKKHSSLLIDISYLLNSKLE